MAFGSSGPASRPPSGRLRVGYFEDVTTRLLTNGMDRGGMFHTRKGSVSEVRQWLDAAEVDVGLLPCWDFLRVEKLDLVPGTCMSVMGASNVFLLVSKVQPGDIREVLVDHETFGARSLAHLLLPAQTATRPNIVRSDVPLNPEKFDFLGHRAQAFLLAGDNALRINRGAFRWVWDLGHAWTTFTQTPLVLHVWCCRKGLDLKGIDREFAGIAKGNDSAIVEIATKEASRLNIQPAALQRLYGNVFRTTLGSMEVSALRVYARELARIGLVPRARQFTVYSPPKSMVPSSKRFGLSG